MRSLLHLFIFCFLTGFLFADATVSGTVTSASSGNPISGATITALKGNNVIATTTTAVNGTYSMTINPGNYTIRASASTYQISVVGAQLKNNQTTTVNFSLLSNPGTISGTIRDAQTTLPIAGATIQILQNNTLIASTTTNGSGNYTVDNLAPGSYVVSAQATSYQTNFTGAIVQSDQTTTINLSLQPDPGTLSGTVTDSNTGLPISGVNIEVHISGVVIYTALTNGAGLYTITGVAPGSYIVHAHATNYQIGILGATVQSNQTTTLNFSLQPNPGIISGAVTASNTGLPIPSANVEALLNGVPAYSALTDSDGNYTLTGVLPGSYTVLADADNYQSSSTGAIVQSGETSTVNFSLQPDPGTIAGTVTDSNTGLPIASATIQVIQSSVVVSTALTDPSGIYNITGIAPGSYTVLATANNYQSNTTGAIVTSNATSTVNFSLNPAPGAVAGTITDSNTSLPISGATIQLIQNGVIITTAVTDTAGQYSITGIQPGSYSVQASALHYQSGLTGAIIQSNVTSTADLVLFANPGIISGTITDTTSGLPIASATVQVIAEGTVIVTTLTNATGGYAITGLAPGSYVVQAIATHYQSNTVGAIVQSDATSTVNFALLANPGGISGTITDTTSGLPIASATVQVIAGGTVIATTLTNATGDYTITGLAPDSYVVQISATNYQSNTVGVIVQSDAASIINLTLAAQPGTIAGTVTDSGTGLPIAGVTIQVTVNNTVLYSTLTDSSGNYIVTGIAPGSYLMYAKFANYQTGSVGVIVQSNATSTINFSLQAAGAGTLTGFVISASSGSPLAGATVEVNLENATIFSTLTNSTGEYSISGVPPGFYVLHAHATDYQTGVVGTTVSSSLSLLTDTTTVNFSLDPNPATVSGTVTDANTGLPIAGATVHIIFEKFIVYSTLTDTSGNYSITGVSAGSYTIHAHATDYQTGVSLFTVTAGESRVINFSLLTGPGTLQGTVTSQSSGLPLANALVEVHYNNLEISFTYTDPSGNYIVPGLPPATYIAHAHLEGYQSALVEVSVGSNQTVTQNFSLASNPSSVTGVVTDAATGLPISGVFINTLLNGLIFDTTLTDGSGSYAQGGLAPGTYEMVTNKSNYVSKTIDYTIGFDTAMVINIQLISIFSPPRNLVGTTINNNFVLQTDRIHHLAWQASINPNTVSYRIYRNEVLISTLSATSPLIYNDHNRTRGVLNTYKITAININGEESPGVLVSLF